MRLKLKALWLPTLNSPDPWGRPGQGGSINALLADFSAWAQTLAADATYGHDAACLITGESAIEAQGVATQNINFCDSPMAGVARNYFVGTTRGSALNTAYTGSILAHETGHIVGLGHVDGSCPGTWMMTSSPATSSLWSSCSLATLQVQ